LIEHFVKDAHSMGWGVEEIEEVEVGAQRGLASHLHYS
jgi:hypothetical protein